MSSHAMGTVHHVSETNETMSKFSISAHLTLSPMLNTILKWIPGFALKLNKVFTNQKGNEITRKEFNMKAQLNHNENSLSSTASIQL